jgi:mRNA interferase MazF
MSLSFYPDPGTLLICDFDTGFRPPEMVKKRMAVVVARKSRQLSIVVPLSSTEPSPIEKWHVEMSLDSLPKSMCKRCWAKCDMVSCVAMWRLDRIKSGKCPTTGKRLYVAPKITDFDLGRIRDALRHVLCL